MGAWWVWDARLTSELILLFLYLGYIALVSAIEEPRMAARAGAVLLLVGVVNIPIIHYSVEWWNTLHQGPTVTKFGKPSIHVTMLVPLLLMALAFQCYYFTVALLCARTELLERERRSAWVREMLAGSEAAVDLPRSVKVGVVESRCGHARTGRLRPEWGLGKGPFSPALVTGCSPVLGPKALRFQYK